ncbi:hypothetical protein M0534_09515 [Methylonatrum kenyense]|uniref:hypothetical protein n=1 Tax=Methylonatrum kenyense TaxID=455253 RepID=UPI0020BD7F34|nr:hypothetical protein [Methylonatrum kenyense]MCK8516560.1 hypothetical protein [Methylonatrum kenyense]
MPKDLYVLSHRQAALATVAGQRIYGMVLDHAMHMVSLQLDVMGAYSQFALGQCRSLQAFVDSPACRDFLSKREALIGELSQRLSGDADGMANLQRDLAEEWQRITRENVISFADAAELRNQLDAAD